MKRLFYIVLLFIGANALGQVKITPIVTVKDTVATLNATDASGLTGAYSWKAVPAATFVGSTDGGNTFVPKTVLLKRGVKYTFTITVWDKYGSPPVATSYVYDPTVIVPPVVKDTIQAYWVYDKAGKLFVKIFVFSDTTVTILKK